MNRKIPTGEMHNPFPFDVGITANFLVPQSRRPRKGPVDLEGRGLLDSTLLRFARLLFACTRSSRSGFRTLAFASVVLSTGLGVIVIAVSATLIVLVVCHGNIPRV